MTDTEKRARRELRRMARLALVVHDAIGDEHYPLNAPVLIRDGLTTMADTATELLDALGLAPVESEA